jgi:hypothetical protein
MFIFCHFIANALAFSARISLLDISENSNNYSPFEDP